MPYADLVARSRSYPYWRDDKQRHHVPKRAIEELIVHAS